MLDEALLSSAIFLMIFLTDLDSSGPKLERLFKFCFFTEVRLAAATYC